MTELKNHELFKVAGGLLPAIAAFIAVIAAPLIIKHHVEEYNHIGRQLSEALYEHNHPYDPNKP